MDSVLHRGRDSDAIQRFFSADGARVDDRQQACRPTDLASFLSKWLQCLCKRYRAFNPVLHK